MTTLTKRMGDYELVKEIGQGSLGTVYVAEHRFLKRLFVLKVLREDLGSDRALMNRLEHEVASLALLDHPHIVKIHTVSYADGSYFLVYDCIVDDYGETTTLAQYLSSQEQGLDEEVVLKIARQLAMALDDARPLMHGGLKLNNVLIGRGDEGVHVYLSDFGLTKVMGPGFALRRLYASLSKSRTKELAQLHSSFVQSFAFLAPEQKVVGAPVTGKEDVYAFGVLVYYLLMRRVPEGVFELPSERFGHLKEGWDRLILSCLQECPGKRPSKLVSALDEMDMKPSQVHFQPVIKPSEIVRPEYEDDPSAIFQKELEVRAYVPTEKERKEVEPQLTEMVVVPGGEYERGSQNGARDEMPRHRISVSSFAMDVHPVTNEQFALFLEAMGGEKDGNNNDIICLRDSRMKRKGGKIIIESGYAKHPVVGVSWYGAVAYAKWCGKRLPTEAEWEIAAYGGNGDNVYPSGKVLERSHANFFNSDTIAVKSYPPNGYGLFDMAGNVYEWCQDWYSYQYYDISVQEPDNPKGPLQGVYRILRGGCWKSLKEDLRCAHRHRNNPGTMNRTYGFRCCTDVKEG